MLEVRITKRDHVGFMRRHTVLGEGRDPKITERCLSVGKGRPRGC